MLGQSQTPRVRGSLAAVGLVALVLSGGLAWYLNRVTDDHTAPTAAPSAPSRPTTDDGVPDAATSRPARPPASARPRDSPTPTSPPPPAVEPPSPELRVDSDVAGAMVFINRKFLGKTPLVTRNVTPGTHQLNVVADGYDAVVRTIEIGDETTSVDIELKQVTLDDAVDVVHKHAFGSCEGRLAASVKGLRYEPSQGDHAFSFPWGQLGTFRVDYLDKTLRVEQEGGRTWNFTTRAENADPLFVFHRDVEKARAQLSTN
ncbi:MAG: PEGA domain-containing protein [Luteitalea sp.]|nr:PEGA domain-containing protein [Luteitalea sp.]